MRTMDDRLLDNIDLMYKGMIPDWHCQVQLLGEIEIKLGKLYKALETLSGDLRDFKKSAAWHEGILLARMYDKK